MKKGLLLGTIATGFLFSQNSVFALTGNANVELNGNDKANVGETFEITMNINNIQDVKNGIVSFEGNLDFDSDTIEFIGADVASEPYEFYINEDYNYKLAGLDLTLASGIVDNTKIYTFTFKALKEGNTTVTVKNYKLTNTDDYVNATVIPKTVVIEKEETIVEEKTEIEEIIPTEIHEEETVIQEKIVPETIEKIETKEINKIYEVEVKENTSKKEFNLFKNGFNKVSNILNKLFKLFR